MSLHINNTPEKNYKEMLSSSESLASGEAFWCLLGNLSKKGKMDGGLIEKWIIGERCDKI